LAVDLADFSMSAPGRAGLVLGYGGIAGPRIDEGLTRLAAAFTAVAR